MSTSQTLSSRPLISFIITTYNIPGDLLCECLKSITALSLTREQREIIVIDDGSEISLVNELTEIADDIIYLRQPNRGLSSARNIGLQIANGVFIQFIDGDDCLLQASYEHCLDIIRYYEPVDMVLFLESQSKDNIIDVAFNGPMTGVQFMNTHNMRASACGYIFRADRLGTLRFTPGIYHEDEEFTPQLLLHMHDVYTTPAKAYYYRQRSGSITHTVDKKENNKRLNDILGVILHLQAIAQQDGDEERKEALTRRIAQLSMDYLVNVIWLTRSHRRLGDAIRLLRKHGLFPLPDKRYTRKYIIFSRLIQSRIGRIILMTLL